jgi:general secretion pathway protein A
MNERHFGLAADPFSLTSDPEVFYRSSQHTTAERVLEYALESGAAFSLLTGEIGCGKSLLVSRLLSRLGDSVMTGLISHPHIRLTSIYRLVASALDIKHKSVSDTDIHQALVSSLQKEYAKGRRTLIVVDEAQNLSVEVLEELRLLSNANTSTNFLQILLVGESQLRARLHCPQLAHLAQRIGAQCHLSALERDETHSYIRHRLQIAGGNPSLFTAEAMNLVHERTRGVPRLINQLCHFMLAQAHASERMRIDGELMRQVPPEFAGSFALQTAPEASVRPRNRRATASAVRPFPIQPGLRPAAVIAAAVALAFVGVAVWQRYGLRAISAKAGPAVASRHNDPVPSAPTSVATVARDAAPPAASVDPAPTASASAIRDARASESAPARTVSVTPSAPGATHSSSVRPGWYLSRASERLNAGDPSAAERLLQQASAAGATPADKAELRAGIEAQELELRLMAAGDQVRAAIASNSLLDPATDNAETRYREMSNLSSTDPLTLRARRELHAALLAQVQEAIHKDQPDLVRRYLAAVARIGPAPESASSQEPLREELNRREQRATAAATPVLGASGPSRQ